MKYFYSSLLLLFVVHSSAQTPTLLKDIHRYSNNGSINTSNAIPNANYLTVSGITYFTADDSYRGVELWKTDGTREGTVLVKDINPFGSSWPQNFTNVNDTLFFSVYSSSFSAGYELWKSDGTETGTVRIKGGFTAAVPDYFVNNNGVLYFASGTNDTGSEIWKSDGTEAGTVLIKDINPGSTGSNPGDLTNVNGTIFFRAGENG